MGPGRSIAEARLEAAAERLRCYLRGFVRFVWFVCDVRHRGVHKPAAGERPPTSSADFGRQHDYAKRKYYEALKCLIGSEPLDQRLHSAMFPLCALSPNDLPEDMRADHENLRYALAVREITWEVSEQNIPSADELATKMLSIYTRLMGGAPETWPDYNPASGPNGPPKLLPGWFAAMLDEEGPRN
jgi:hypothetical protein